MLDLNSCDFLSSFCRFASGGRAGCKRKRAPIALLMDGLELGIVWSAKWPPKLQPAAPDKLGVFSHIGLSIDHASENE